jgi:hypothetical protein
MAGDSAAIRKLSREGLGPREFAERLLALQSIEPKLTPEEIKDWDDAELTAVVRAWWEEVDRLNSSPLPAGSLEAFQGAIGRRIAEQAERMRALPRDISFAISKIPEFNIAEKMAREIARSNSLLDLAGHNSALQAIRQAELAAPIPLGLSTRPNSRPHLRSRSSFGRRTAPSQSLRNNGASWRP